MEEHARTRAQTISVYVGMDSRAKTVSTKSMLAMATRAGTEGHAQLTTVVTHAAVLLLTLVYTARPALKGVSIAPQKMASTKTFTTATSFTTVRTGLPTTRTVLQTFTSMMSPRYVTGHGVPTVALNLPMTTCLTVLQGDHVMQKIPETFIGDS